METVLDFFAVRPVFTLLGLRVLWAAYLIDQLLPFLAILTRPNFSDVSFTALLVLFLRACLNVIIFRLLIEVAASVLFRRST
jgi:hypothetical protein